MVTKYIKYAFFCLIAYIFIKGGYDGCKYEEELLANKAFTKGLITGCAFLSKSVAYNIEFEFHINNQKITSNEKKTGYHGICDSVKNKTFPVVYSTKWPQSCHILMYIQDDIEYGLSKEESKKIMSQ